MSGHAKLPWETRADGWQPWPGAIAIISDDGYVIAYTTSGGSEKENADLLCTTASSHADLVKALELARARIEYLGAACSNPKHFEANASEFLPRIDAALAAASRSTAEGRG